MLHAIKTEIKRISRRIHSKISQEDRVSQQHKDRFAKRTGKNPNLSQRPLLSKDKHFDPAYCARNANFLAKTIWHKVLERTYVPEPAICFRIPKPSGDYREVMAFSIPDAALANVVLRRVRNRNVKKFSSSSYAYQSDRNIFDAILALRTYDTQNKIFVIQIDFEKYFDNIPTKYLQKKIKSKNNIYITPYEKYIFEQFMHHEYIYKEKNGHAVHRHRFKGIPQGSSISLFLANLANHDLDIKLSYAAGFFVRFADDVIALCTDYSQALQIEHCFTDHCQTSGLKINRKKSPGIAILSDFPQEMRTIPSFDYLGYRFTCSGLTIQPKTIKKLKSKISRLINLYLLHYLKIGFNRFRCSSYPAPYDWDLLGLIGELRYSLYGGLDEKQLENFLQLHKRLPKMRGLMSFYCLLEDSKPLREMDGWMLSMVRRSLRERNSLIKKINYNHSCPLPSNKQLAMGTWLDPTAWDGPNKPDARMPSFVRGWRAAKKYFYTYGMKDIKAPTYGAYDNFADLFDIY